MTGWWRTMLSRKRVLLAANRRLARVNRDLWAENRLLRGLVEDARTQAQVHAQRTGQLLALTADHARAEKTIESLAQLMTLTSHEKATLLEAILQRPAPRPEFEAAPTAPPAVTFDVPPGDVLEKIAADPLAVVAGAPGRSGDVWGDALQRARDARDEAQRRPPEDEVGIGVFDDLGETRDEITRNLARLSGV